MLFDIMKYRNLMNLNLVSFGRKFEVNCVLDIKYFVIDR